MGVSAEHGDGLLDMFDLLRPFGGLLNLSAKSDRVAYEELQRAKEADVSQPFAIRTNVDVVSAPVRCDVGREGPRQRDSTADDPGDPQQWQVDAADLAAVDGAVFHHQRPGLDAPPGRHGAAVSPALHPRSGHAGHSEGGRRPPAVAELAEHLPRA